MKRPFMRMFWGDYDADTGHLTQGQHGAYLLLIKHYWTRGSLPASQQQCSIIAKALTPEDQENVRFVLTEFFTLEEDRYYHKRIEEEMAVVQEGYEKRALAAKSRWDKHPEQRRTTATAMQGAMQVHVRSQKSESSLRSDATKPKTKPARRATAYPEGFAPNEGHQALAKELGLPLEAEMAKFRDHHTAKGTVFKDWDAALRTWLRNSVTFRRPGQQVQGSTPHAAGVAIGDWWRTDAGVLAKGKELGLEVSDELRAKAGWIVWHTARVFHAAGDGPWMRLADRDATLERMLGEIRRREEERRRAQHGTGDFLDT